MLFRHRRGSAASEHFHCTRPGLVVVSLRPGPSEVTTGDRRSSRDAVGDALPDRDDVHFHGSTRANPCRRLWVGPCGSLVDSGVVETFEVPLSFERTLASRSRSGDRLAVVVVGDIANGEHPGHVGGGAPRNGLEIPVLLHRQLTLVEVGAGSVADRDEHTGDGKLGSFAGLDIFDLDPGQGVLAQVLGDDRVPEKLDLGVAEGPVLHDLRGAELVAAMDDGDLLGEAAEEVGLLQCRVTTANDRNVVVTEEKAIAGGARREAVTDESGLTLEAQHDRLGSGRDDQRVGLIGGFSSVRVADPDAIRGSGEVDLARLHRLDLCAEPFGLRPEVHHEFRTHDPLGKPGKVLDVGRQHQLTTGLVAGGAGFALEDERGKIGPGRVDRCGQPGGAGSDDDDVANVGHDDAFPGGSVSHSRDERTGAVMQQGTDVCRSGEEAVTDDHGDEKQIEDAGDRQRAAAGAT